MRTFSETEGARDLEELPVTEDLHDLRSRVANSSAIAQLPASKRADFVFAVNEAATNAIKYDEPPRTLRLWREADAVVGEVVARGTIEDPLAGRRRPGPRAVRGRGLWMVNQLCDRVELRNREGSTRVRMRMRCG